MCPVILRVTIFDETSIKNQLQIFRYLKINPYTARKTIYFITQTAMKNRTRIEEFSSMFCAKLIPSTHSCIDPFYNTHTKQQLWPFLNLILNKAEVQTSK